MRLILFVENLKKASLEDDRPMQEAILSFFRSFGELDAFDFYGTKYLIGLFTLNSRKISLLDCYFETLEVKLSCRYFLEFRQFKRFLLNLEKKFLYFDTTSQPSRDMDIVLAVIRQSKGSVLYKVIRKGHEDESESVLLNSTGRLRIILELEQKKNGLTAAKLLEFNQELRGIVYLQKIKVLAPLLSHYKNSLAPKHHWDCYTKPTTKLYHHLFMANQAKLVDLSKNYCFKLTYSGLNNPLVDNSNLKLRLPMYKGIGDKPSIELTVNDFHRKATQPLTSDLA